MNIQQLIEKHENVLKTLTRDAQELDDDTADAVDVMVNEDAISRESQFLVELRGLLPETCQDCEGNKICSTCLDRAFAKKV